MLIPEAARRTRLVNGLRAPGAVAALVIVAGVQSALATGPTEYRSSAGPTLAARDLPRVLDSQPRLPKAKCVAEPQKACSWSVEQRDPYLYPIPAHAPAFTLAELFGGSPTRDDLVLVGKLKRAGFQIGRHLAWRFDSDDPRLRGAHGEAVVFAFLFRAVSGARAGFRALVPGYAPRGVKRLPSQGLGEESRGSYDAGSVEAAGYLWRRRNLVVFVSAACEPACRAYDNFHRARYHFSPVPLARAWADQIDVRAKRKSA